MLGPGPACPSVQGQQSIDDEYAPAVFQVRLPADRQTGGGSTGPYQGHTRSAVCRLATLHSAPSSPGHRADDLGPGSACSVEETGRQRPRAMCHSDGWCARAEGPREGAEPTWARGARAHPVQLPSLLRKDRGPRAHGEQAWDSGQPVGGQVWGRAGLRGSRHGLALLILPHLPFSPVGPAAVGLPPIRLRAVATSGFLPEAGGPRVSPALPRVPSVPHLGVPSAPVAHCPCLLRVPEQLLCLQSDIWDSHGPWLLGPPLPQLVRRGLG